MNATTHLCPAVDEWHRFLSGQIGGELADEYEAHLAGCESCASRIQEMELDDSLSYALRRGSRILSSLESSNERETSTTIVNLEPDSAGARWDDVLDPPTTPGDLGRMAGYRVLSLLGRGGNGRVYLAYDARLGRHVALKVILDDRWRGPRDLARFEREACLLAQLEHPAIVRIFEVGSHRGRPYMALEYVAGGTLAGQLKGRPWLVSEAVRVTLDLAVAVGHAHERGIIHRDLKPGNVLFAKPNEVHGVAAGEGSADHAGIGNVSGRLKVADFGLARRFEDDDLTRTGDVLGTPGYTAPELFEGRTNAGTVASDIYSLGAILYELLVGRPPFRGDSSLETIELARTQDPLSPRRLRPALPRDLETICLKCLEREPARRYATVTDLIEDLTRFLDHRPILARPVGRLTRVAKWLKRRPTVAGMASLLLLFLLAATMGGAFYERSLQNSLSETRMAVREARDKRVESERQARRADDNYAQAREALRLMLLHAADPRWNGVPRLQQLRRQQAETALAFFRHAADQYPTDAKARLDAARAAIEAGKLQIFLGRKDEGIATLRRALKEAEELRQAQPRDLTAAQAVADACIGLGAQAISEEHLALVERGVAILGELTKASPESSSLHSSHTDALITMSAVYVNAGRYQDAEAPLLEAIRRDDDWLRDHPDDLAKLTRRARSRVNLCAAYRQLKRGEESRANHLLAETDFERIIRLDPANRATIDGLAALRINGAYDLQAENRIAEAIEYVERNLPMLEEALRREPEDALYRDRLLRTFGVASTMYGALGDKRKAAETWVRVVELTPPEELPTRRVLLVSAWLDALDLQRAMGEVENARNSLRESSDEELWKEWTLVLERLGKACRDDETLDYSLRSRYVEQLQIATEEAARRRPVTRAP